MTMYVTKVWGLASEDWPVITFSRQGVRNRLQSLWQPGDTMLLVGTKTKETQPEDRGKILGYLKFTAIPVRTKDVVHPEVLAKHGDKWPYALLCTELWTLNNPPIFKEYLSEVDAKNPGMMLASNFAALKEDEEASILLLPAKHEILPQTEKGQGAVDTTTLVNFIRGGGRGPVTYTGRFEVTRTSSPARTYLLTWKSKHLMKVGWAYDPESRAQHLSESLVPESTGEEWKHLQSHPFPDEYSAYFMEQTIIDLLDSKGISRFGEYFKIPAKLSIITSDIWVEALRATTAYLEKISEEERVNRVAELLSEEI